MTTYLLIVKKEGMTVKFWLPGLTHCHADPKDKLIASSTSRRVLSFTIQSNISINDSPNGSGFSFLRATLGAEKSHLRIRSPQREIPPNQDQIPAQKEAIHRNSISIWHSQMSRSHRNTSRWCRSWRQEQTSRSARRSTTSTSGAWRSISRQPETTNLGDPVTEN